MKNALIVLLCVGFALSGFAQELDTLGWETFNNGIPTLYASPNGGYAFGNNGYGDKAKAQSFISSESVEVHGALVDLGFVQFDSGDSTSYVAVNLYRNDSLGITVLSNTDSVAPGTLWASDTIFVYQLDTLNGLLRVNFEPDTLIFNEEERFSVGVDLSGMVAGDTLGVNSTTDGDALGADNAWELTSAGQWIVIAQPAYSWNLDVDLGIFALTVAVEPAGLLENELRSFNVYPNPTARYLNIESNTICSNGCQLVITDALGKVVMSEQNHRNQLVDVDRLPEGYYVLSMQDGNSRYYSKFLKLQ